MPNDRLPQKLLFGQVKGLRRPGCPRSSFNDVTVRDCQLHRTNKPYKDAQNTLLDGQDLPRMYLAHHELGNVSIIIIIIIIIIA